MHVFIFVNGRSELERMSVERQINSTQQDGSRGFGSGVMTA